MKKKAEIEKNEVKNEKVEVSLEVLLGYILKELNGIKCELNGLNERFPKMDKVEKCD